MIISYMNNHYKYKNRWEDHVKSIIEKKYLQIYNIQTKEALVNRRRDVYPGKKVCLKSRNYDKLSKMTKKKI